MKYLKLDDLAGLSTVSVEEAAHLIGISRTSMYEAVRRGELEVVQFGRRVRVLARPLYQLLAGDPPQLGARDNDPDVGVPESGDKQ